VCHQKCERLWAWKTLWVKFLFITYQDNLVANMILKISILLCKLYIIVMRKIWKKFVILRKCLVVCKVFIKMKHDMTFLRKWQNLWPTLKLGVGAQYSRRHVLVRTDFQPFGLKSAWPQGRKTFGDSSFELLLAHYRRILYVFRYLAKERSFATIASVSGRTVVLNICTEICLFESPSHLETISHISRNTCPFIKLSSGGSFRRTL